MLAVRNTLAVLLAMGLVLAAGSSAEAFTILGTGTTALLDGDLTDPNDTIDDNAGKTTPPYYAIGYDFTSAYASTEPWFSYDGTGGRHEASLDIFDNIVAGGRAKYCCGGAPWSVAVQLHNSYFLTHFTAASSNDSPNRDPDVWQIVEIGIGRTLEGLDDEIDVAEIDHLVDLDIHPHARGEAGVFHTVFKRADRVAHIAEVCGPLRRKPQPGHARYGTTRDVTPALGLSFRSCAVLITSSGDHVPPPSFVARIVYVTAGTAGAVSSCKRLLCQYSLLKMSLERFLI